MARSRAVTLSLALLLGLVAPAGGQMGLFPNDAVERTQNIQGTIVFDPEGKLTADSKITVNLRTLTSDAARRDNYLRRNTLATDSFPHAVFVPEEIRGLAFPFPASAKANLQILGNLTR